MSEKNYYGINIHASGTEGDLARQIGAAGGTFDDAGYLSSESIHNYNIGTAEHLKYIEQNQPASPQRSMPLPERSVPNYMLLVDGAKALGKGIAYTSLALSIGPFIALKWGIEKITGHKISPLKFGIAMAGLVGLGALVNNASPHNSLFSGNVDWAAVQRDVKEREAMYKNQPVLPPSSTTPVPAVAPATAEALPSTALPPAIVADMKADALAQGFYKTTRATDLYAGNNAKSPLVTSFEAGTCVKVHGVIQSNEFVAVSVQPWSSDPATNGYVRGSDLAKTPSLDCKQS